MKNGPPELERSAAIPIPRQVNPSQVRLSFAQERIWLFEQLSPRTHAHHLAAQIQLVGPLDTEALRRAVREVVTRHETLRTAVQTFDGMPMQVVSTSVVADVEEVGRTDPAKSMSELLHAPFDLSRAPLFRMRLLRAGDHPLLQIVIHQLVADTYSLELMLGEIATSYSEHRLAELPVQYRDYSIWQRARFDMDKRTRQLGYWKQKLSGELRPLEVPLDHPRPMLQSFAGAEETIDLPEPLLAKLKKLTDDEITSNVVLMAAFYVLLFRYTGEEDLSVGTPIMQRVRPETFPLIGPFSNTLVIRVNIAERPTFRALLRSVVDALVEAFDHQSLSFAELIEELQPARDLSRSPLFQVMFDPTRFRSRTITAGELTMIPQNVSSEVSAHDLTLLVNERDHPVRVKLEYNTALYQADTARRLLAHYRSIVESAAANPDLPIDRIPLLSPNERNLLLYGWNATAIERPDRPLVHEEIAARAVQSPNAVALIMGELELTYRELDTWANRVAHRLIELGVGPGERVGLCVERSFEMVVGLLAVLKAGGAYVPIDPTHPSARNSLILEQATPRVVLSRDVDFPKEGPTSAPATTAGAEDLAYVIFTSGSTGKPKGVEITHRALSNLLHATRTTPGLRASDRTLAVTTISFDIAALELLLPLVTGGSVDIADHDTCVDAERLRARLEQKPITMMQATPTTWRMLIEAGWRGNPNLKVLCGGEGFPRDLADQLLERAASVWNMYGPTETTIWSSVQPVDAGPNPVPIGRPIDNTTMHVIDNCFEPVPIGVVGELLIGGRGLARGYHRQPELTKEKFVDDPFVAGSRLYRTGDLAKRLATGELVCLGRADFQVKIRGFRIELGEIEAALLAHPDVKNAAVIARDEAAEKRLIGYVEGRRAIDDEALRKHLEDRVPPYMIPARFVVMDALPLTPNGKIDRRALPAPAATRAMRPTFQAPSGDLEVQMASIWREVLALERVGRNESFFELGGHSLLAVKLVNRLNKECGIGISLGAVFQTPTIGELAALVDAEWRHREPSVIQLEAGSEGAVPLFCICGIHLYAELARHLGDSRPIYGVFVPLEAELFNGQVHALTVEELAAEYLKAIRTTQPRGPYCLTGVSFGGVLAFEIARQLRRESEEVRFLALLDSLLPRALTLNPRAWIKARVGKVLSEGPRGLGLQLKNVSGRLKDAFKERLRPGFDLINAAPDVDEMRVSRNQIYNRATAIYDRDEHTYDGPVILVRAQDTDDISGYAVDSCFGWNQLVDAGVHLYEIPGGHLDILQEPHVTTLAEKLRHHLDER